MLWPVANMSWCFWMPGAELNGVFHTYAPTPRGQSWLVFMHPKCPGSLSGGLCVNFRCGTWGWAGLPARPPLLRHVVLSWWFPLVWGWGGSEYPPGLGDRCGAPAGNPVSGGFLETIEVLGCKLEDWYRR